MEFVNIIKDIRDGNLPASEIPSFFFYLLRQSFWFWFVLVIGGMIGIVIGH